MNQQQVDIFIQPPTPLLPSPSISPSGTPISLWSSSASNANNHFLNPNARPLSNQVRAQPELTLSSPTPHESTPKRTKRLVASVSSNALYDTTIMILFCYCFVWLAGAFMGIGYSPERRLNVEIQLQSPKQPPIMVSNTSRIQRQTAPYDGQMVMIGSKGTDIQGATGTQELQNGKLDLEPTTLTNEREQAIQDYLRYLIGEIMRNENPPLPSLPSPEKADDAGTDNLLAELTSSRSGTWKGFSSVWGRRTRSRLHADIQAGRGNETDDNP